MPSLTQLFNAMDMPVATNSLARLYGRQTDQLAAQRLRYLTLLQSFQHQFPEHSNAELFSTSGRTELGGNHTDHNCGHVLAGAVDLDLLAVVAPAQDETIRIVSQGYEPIEVNTNSLEAVAAEQHSSAALVRGVAGRLRQLGHNAGGFVAVMISDVPDGAGLSSSAAFEVQIANILNILYNNGSLEPLLLAQAGQFAENFYFGKPCGLMDQTACAVGGLVSIDFSDPLQPVIHKLNYDFAGSGYALVIVETGGSHADLTEDYAAVASEMKAVAQALGTAVLRQTSREKVLEQIPFLRKQVGDRAILRALHFFDDDQRVLDEVHALESGNTQAFLRLVLESGTSSYMLNQNVFSPRYYSEQGVSLALALTSRLVGERGAWRVHGGGFAGTIQVYLPYEALEGYIESMEAVFGAGACHPVLIRPVGACLVEIV